MKYYKLLNKDGTPSNGGGKSSFKYALPDGRKKGAWMPYIDNIELCSRGYHVAPLEHILDWRGDMLCEAEIGGEIKTDDKKIVASAIRLTKIIKGWNAKNLRLFAADCAERVLPIFEKKHPDDDRPRLAIEAARAFANGKISIDALLKARAAAAYAAHAAADAYDAAAAAAAADAYAYAAYAAAYAAHAAADAADYAAYAAAAASDSSKERKWQIERLAFYLNIKL